MKADLAYLSHKRICVALSGGSDSVALCHFLLANREKYSFSLSAVNCEHGIRGEESVNDSLFVKSFCESLNIPLFFFSENCIEKAKREKISLETAARNFRYRAFDKILKEGKADVIATAHHANDNAETVLFNLARGSALSGLKGISDREGFVRPLINVTKGEIEEYIKENSLPYVTDLTNFSEDYTRNFFRLNVLPQIEKAVPSAIKNIARFSEIAKEDDEFLYSLAKELIREEEDQIKISLVGERPLFLRAALTAMKKMGVEKDYTYEHLNSIYSLIEKNNGDGISLPKNITAVREYDCVCIYYNKERSFEEKPFKTGDIKIGEYLISVNKEPSLLRFDLNKLPQGCVFRFKRNGDVFKKFGGGTKKLKDYLIDKKIPQKDRDFIPLIAKDEEVFCVCGVEISDKIKIEENGDVYYIHLKKL